MLPATCQLPIGTPWAGSGGRWQLAQHLPQPQLGCLRPLSEGGNWHLGQPDLTSIRLESSLTAVTSWGSMKGLQRPRLP